MKRVSFLVLLALAALLAVEPAHAWRGMEWDATNNRLTFTSNVVMSGTATITGAQTFTGAATFNGSVTLGDASADVVTINADTINATHGSNIKCESLTAVDSQGFLSYGSTGKIWSFCDASTERFGVTTTTSAGAVVLTFTDAAGAATITYDHDATAEFVCNHGFEALELNSATIGAADGTNAITIADSTGAITIPGAATSFSNVACTVGFGTASSTTGSQVSVFDGGSDNKPGALLLYKDNGNTVCIFPRTDGTLAYHTAYPTDDDADGVALGTFNMAADVDLTDTNGTAADPDLSVAGVASFAKGGLILAASSAPPLATSTPEGCIWVTNGSPNGGKTAYKLYVFVNSTWTAVH
jgi:hypothetical protein